MSINKSTRSHLRVLSNNNRVRHYGVDLEDNSFSHGVLESWTILYVAFSRIGRPDHILYVYAPHNKILHTVYQKVLNEIVYIIN